MSGMADDPENLTLRLLQVMRGEIQAMRTDLQQMRADLQQTRSEMNKRFADVTQRINGSKLMLAYVAVSSHDHEKRITVLEERY